MAETLSALDGTFLELEDADPSAHMHIGGILVFDPGPHGRPPTLSEVRRHIDARLGAVPRYRQRLSSPRPGGLGWPHWEDDPTFDLAHHLRRAAVPAPGGWNELLEWGSDFYARRLERTRPLWEVVLLEGLPEGRWALATKTHHSLVDGVGSVDASHLLLDPTPDGPDPRVAAAAATNGNANGNGNGHRRGLPGLPWWIAGPAGMVLHPERALRALERAGALAELLANEEVRAAPHTSLNDPIGPERVLRGVEVPLDDVRDIAHALGGTVNDVVLTAVAGGLRALLVRRGETPPEAGVRAMVPVNVRTDDERGGRVLGNRISSLFIDLPADAPTAAERFALVCERAGARKTSAEPLGADTLLSLVEHLPPVLHTIFAQTLYADRLFNLTVTNVPGPRSTLYALGAPLRTIYPLVPLAADHAVGISVLSYDRGVCFGINAARDSVPDVDVLSAGIAAELVDLQRVAQEVT